MQRFHRHGLAGSAAPFQIEWLREQLKPFASYERLPTNMEMQPTRMPDAPWMCNKSHQHLIADGIRWQDSTKSDSAMECYGRM
jgi:hypothetical protein